MTQMDQARPVLPAGVSDVLAPHAAHEAATAERLMASFAAWGYERVAPPLFEFETAMLAGSGAALADRTFRLMDPVSQHMLAIRPDMTMQVARIATERLGRQVRPLRLSYAGQVARVRGSQLRPLRQFNQAGAELIGADGAAADAEVVLMACEALAGLGVERITLDLGIPTLVPALLAASGVEAAAAGRLRTALDRKDAAAVDAMAGDLGAELTAVLSNLVRLTGPAAAAVDGLRRLVLPDDAARERAVLVDVFERIRRDAPWLEIGVDPVERRGFEYHTGVTFALFAAGVAGDMGRGGRYRAGAVGEAATGITLFLDAVLAAVPAPQPEGRIYAPERSDAETVRALRRTGRCVVQGLAAVVDVEAEAARLRCVEVLAGGGVRAVSTKGNKRETE